MADQPRRRGRPPLPEEERARRAQQRVQNRIEQNRQNRQDEDYREREQSQDTQRHRAARAVNAARVNAAAQAADTQRRRQRRLDAQLRAAERAADAQRHRERRQDEEARAAERVADAQRRELARQNEEVRAAEQAVNNQQHRERRQNPVVRAAEQAINTQQRAARREDPVAQMREEERRLWRELNAAEAKYEIDISDGPIHVCSCCVRLIFRTSIDKTINFRTDFPRSWDFDFVDFHCPLDARVDADTIQLCYTCVKYLKRRRLPPFCFSTFRLPVIPPLLSTASRLAIRMASRRIAFMHIKKLGYDGQLVI